MATIPESAYINGGACRRIDREFSPYWQSLFERSSEGCGTTYRRDLGSEVENVTFIYVPEYAVGHRGITHGGFLATLLDEALCRCGFAVLPHYVGVTASLDLSYKAPTPAGSWVALRATAPKPDVASRKAWVKGCIYLVDVQSEKPPWEYNKPTIEAKLLVVEPHWWEKLAREGLQLEEA